MTIELHAGRWGIEDTGRDLWVGPMRPDGAKVADIVYVATLVGLTEEAIALRRARAELIVDAVNATAYKAPPLPEALAKALAYFTPSESTNGPVILTGAKMREAVATIRAALHTLPSEPKMAGGDETKAARIALVRAEIGRRWPKSGGEWRTMTAECAVEALDTALRTLPSGKEREADGLGDGRAVCEALGFDPTNHHNALKCPYCNPKGLRFAEVVPSGKEREGWSFQARNAENILHICDGAGDPTDVAERRDRFGEEALELQQALGQTREAAHALVDYVFSRPVGEPAQEMGGTMTTLAGLAVYAGLDALTCGEAELALCWTPEKVEKIRRKRANRHGRGPLPGVDASPKPSRQEGERS